MNLYRPNRRECARKAFPQIRDREMLLCVGRIDAVKNPALAGRGSARDFQRHPNALLVLAGACTDETYGDLLRAPDPRTRPGQPRCCSPAVCRPLMHGSSVCSRRRVPCCCRPFPKPSASLFLKRGRRGRRVIASRTSGATALNPRRTKRLAVRSTAIRARFTRRWTRHY